LTILISLIFLIIGLQYLYQWQLPLLFTLQAIAQSSRAAQKIIIESLASTISTQENSDSHQDRIGAKAAGFREILAAK
jgi:hypothetical protein